MERNRHELKDKDGEKPTVEQLSLDYVALSDEQKREVRRRAGEESEVYFRKRWKEAKRILEERHDALGELFMMESLGDIDEKKLKEALRLEGEGHNTLVTMLQEAIKSMRLDEHIDSRTRAGVAERLGVDQGSLQVDLIMAMTKYSMGRHILHEDEVTRKALEYLSPNHQTQDARIDFNSRQGWYFESPEGQATLGRIVQEVSAGHLEQGGS